ncbi:hypothetical protein COLO4_24521 [Corchorus olitorius]|uniref:Pentacotripeptide-repeat region of PRORP domain-containing protein n=1 Tax=Corchorus olitorius TaxID=93759 RepID=A0A1R3I9C8_9ROSI|nr:hypothetical protein COLO4_24521 [Corchorus olitorius]
MFGFGMSRALLPKHVAAVVKYQKDPLKALELFNAVKKEDGFKHTLLTYKCMIEKLGYHGEFEAMEKVLQEMRMNVDNSLLEGVYIGCMRNYGRKQKVQEAINVFERMDFYNCEPTVLSYNAIMNILVEYGYFNQAHKVYMRMRDKGITPDVYTFTIRIKSFCRTRRPQAALRLLRSIPLQGCEINAVAYCTVVGGFFEENHHVEAYELFDEMLRLGLTPNITAFNKLIHILCKNGGVQESEKLLNKVLKRGVSPNLFTVNIFIQGLCRKGAVSEAYADKILGDATFKGFVPDEFTYCSLINGLCQDGETDRAGLILQALQLMNEMAENGCSPDIWTYNIVINGLCKMGCVSDANNLLNDAIAKGYLPDIFTFNTLIDGYCKQLKMENAIEILNQMWSYGITPDVITYNSVLNGLCKTSKSEDVIETFKTMVEKGCIPNVITYNILVESLCKARKVNEALNLLEEIEEKGLAPDIVSFSTLINGFCNNGDLDGAYKLFRRMGQRYKVSHTTATYNVMINAFSEKLKINMIEKLFHEMCENGCAPDSYTYRVMIDGFCKTGKVDSGYDFLLQMVEKGFIPSLTTFGRVINCLCVENRVHNAVGLIHLMVGKGIVPEVVNTIFESDKRDVAAPKIVVEDLLKKGHITYYSYELLYDGVRDKKLLKKLQK